MKNPIVEPIPSNTEEIAKAVVDSAFKVHTALGPGLLESVYEACLAHVTYDGMRIESGLRLDLLVEKCVIIEIKAVDAIMPIHKAQLLTYLKLSGLRLGLLINFNVVHLRDGITRLVN